MKRLYIDVCGLSRLTDDPAQSRIRGEAEAVERILRLVISRSITWISSSAMLLEISKNPDKAKRDDVLAVLDNAQESVVLSKEVSDRARDLKGYGYGTFDALHIAFAEAAGCDALITTDDRLIRRAARGAGMPQVRIENPVVWVRENEDAIF